MDENIKNLDVNEKEIYKSYSNEFLVEMIERAKKHLPGWMYAALLQSARPAAGGRAAHRIDEPDVFHKIVLPEIKPEKLKDISDDDLKSIWLKLNQWYTNSKRRGKTVENFVNAGVWVKEEMQRRGLQIGDGEFIQEIDRLKEPNEKIAKSEPFKIFGSDSANVCFVSTSPSKIEAARNEPLVGDIGLIFRDKYLAPLGLIKKDIMLMYAVPELMLDDDQNRRDPTDDEIEKWREFIIKELDGRNIDIIVALGSTAARALGERADIVLPHPAAIFKHKDSGEITRKLKRVKSIIEKSKIWKAAEGGTRSNEALDWWNKNWYELPPKSGEGFFTYQRHWRGLEEDESNLSEQDLFKTNHSIHGDLRLEGNNGELWGFTVFLGETEKNGPDTDRVIDLKQDSSLEVTPKGRQPKEWLYVGAKKPYISPPGESGATSDKYAKFFRIDHGSYKIGVVKQHSVEIFLDGSKLMGRYLIVYAPIAGARRWLIEKPSDQTATATKGDLAESISELRGKNQRYLIWGKPGEKPRLIDVQTGKDATVKIAKSDPLKQIIYGIVLDPYGSNGPTADAHNDWVSPFEVEKTAHGFMEGSRVIGLQHKGKTNAKVVESWIEPYPPSQYKKAMNNDDHRVYRRAFGSDMLHSGSWVLGVKLDDREWKLFQDGKINAFSPGGFGVRRKMMKNEMPKVEFVDLIEGKMTSA